MSEKAKASRSSAADGSSEKPRSPTFLDPPFTPKASDPADIVSEFFGDVLRILANNKVLDAEKRLSVTDLTTTIQKEKPARDLAASFLRAGQGVCTHLTKFYDANCQTGAPTDLSLLAIKQAVDLPWVDSTTIAPARRLDATCAAALLPFARTLISPIEFSDGVYSIMDMILQERDEEVSAGLGIEKATVEEIRNTLLHSSTGSQPIGSGSKQLLWPIPGGDLCVTPVMPAGLGGEWQRCADEIEAWKFDGYCFRKYGVGGSNRQNVSFGNGKISPVRALYAGHPQQDRRTYFARQHGVRFFVREDDADLKRYLALRDSEYQNANIRRGADNALESFARSTFQKFRTFFRSDLDAHDSWAWTKNAPGALVDFLNGSPITKGEREEAATFLSLQIYLSLSEKGVLLSAGAGETIATTLRGSL